MGEKCQAHNLKVVGSNPTPATNYLIKSISNKMLKNFVFGAFLCFKPNNNYRVINKVKKCSSGLFSIFDSIE